MQQHIIRLVGKLAPCSGCLQAKGIRAATPYPTMVRARVSIELVIIDTAGPHLESLGYSRHVIVFVNSTFRLQRPYETPNKSTPAVLAVVKRFVVDMRVSGAFRTDSGSEYMKLQDLCRIL